MTHFTSITIGRNVEDTPMTEDVWTHFHETVADALSVAAHSARAGIVVPVSAFHGTGEWDGITEDSTVVTVVTARPVDIDWLRDRLAALSAGFRQDAIALATGSSELVMPH